MPTRNLTRAQAIIAACLSTGLPDKSLYNCHALGLSSVVLRDMPSSNGVFQSKMTRLFVATPGTHDLSQLHQPDGSFTLAVHNHRYPLMITPLVGDFVNYTVQHSGLLNYSPADRQRYLYGYRYESAILHGESSLTHTQTVVVERENYDYVPVGQTRLMMPYELHTVIIPHNFTVPYTVWMVEEGEDEIDSTLYSPVPLDGLDTAGMYQPMDREHATQITERILKWINKP